MNEYHDLILTEVITSAKFLNIHFSSISANTPTQAPTTQGPIQASTTITTVECNGVPKTDMNCCTRNKPCNIGGGDCDSDYDCAGNLKCGLNNCAADFSSPGSNWKLNADCCFGATPAPTSKPDSCRLSCDNAQDKRQCVLLKIIQLISGLI